MICDEMPKQIGYDASMVVKQSSGNYTLYLIYGMGKI
jgi:hypothetical protein